jgi:signal transduction histidine kinase
MTLKAKLIAAQAPLLAALVVLAALSLHALQRLGASSAAILQDNYRSVLAAQRMKGAIEGIDDDVVRSLLDAGEAPADAAAGRELFERELKVEEGNITEAGEREVAKRLHRQWDEAKSLLDGLPGAPQARRDFYRSRLRPAFTRVYATAEEILAINQDAMVRKSDRVRAASRRLRSIALAGAVLAGTLGLLAAALITRRAVLRPLQVLHQAVRRLGEGDLEVRAAVAGQDEIAQLARDFNAMAERLHQYRKSSLGDLLRAQQAAQASIDSLPEPVVIFGTKGEVLSTNRSAEDLLGGVDTLADLEPALRAALQGIHDHVFGGKGPYAPRGLEEAVRLASPKGERYLLPSANPLYDEDGLTIGVTAVLQDVTRFKRFDELKDDMVSTVAHEFRTPLTSMRMAIHLCLEEAVGPLTPKQADLLGAAREDCERLQLLVDDLLDLSRLQTGRTAMNPEPIPASSLVSQAVGRHRDAAEGRSVALTQQASGEGRLVLADPDRIALVFDNLITNALRYAPAGGTVEVRLRREQGRVRFEVADSGPGIPKAHQDRLFDKMYQVPGAEGGSSGLGLSIAREIVLAHGGEIGVESEPGLGSTFWFTLREAREA